MAACSRSGARAAGGSARSSTRSTRIAQAARRASIEGGGTALLGRTLARGPLLRRLERCELGAGTALAQQHLDLLLGVLERALAGPRQRDAALEGLERLL